MSDDALQGELAAEQARRWARTWSEAGPVLERLRREELRQLDTFETLALLCGPADYHLPPFAPEPTSGLVEQQRWFAKFRHHA